MSSFQFEYVQEMRSGLKGAGKNNGLVLLFETGEDLHLVKQLFNKHRHDVFLDCIKVSTEYLSFSQSISLCDYPADDILV